MDQGASLTPHLHHFPKGPPIFPPIPPLPLTSTSPLSLGFPHLPQLNQSPNNPLIINQSIIPNPPIFPSLSQQQMATIPATQVIITPSKNVVSQGPNTSITPSISIAPSTTQVPIINTMVPLITKMNTILNPWPPPPPKLNTVNQYSIVLQEAQQATYQKALQQIQIQQTAQLATQQVAQATQVAQVAQQAQQTAQAQALFQQKQAVQVALVVQVSQQAQAQ